MTTEVPRSIRLYRYLPAHWALKSVETAELKVSRLSELNDPFEFTPALAWVNSQFSHAVVDDFMSFLVREFDPKWGIICLSEQIHDPVIWSHYADSHRGIALGFDLPSDDQLWPIKYPPIRPVVDVDRFQSMTENEGREMIRAILSAKAPS